MRGREKKGGRELAELFSLDASQLHLWQLCADSARVSTRLAQGNSSLATTLTTMSTSLPDRCNAALIVAFCGFLWSGSGYGYGFGSDLNPIGSHLFGLDSIGLVR